MEAKSSRLRRDGLIPSDRTDSGGSDGELVSLSAKPRLRLLLDYFAKIKDTRQACKVAYPLREVMFLVVCGTIANGDDYDDIVDRRICRSCGDSPSSTSGFPVPTGCAR